MHCDDLYMTRNMHSQRASRQYYYAHAHKPTCTCIAQLCVRMSINDIPDHDGHVHTYVHHENRSLLQSLALMRSSNKEWLVVGLGAVRSLGSCGSLIFSCTRTLSHSSRMSCILSSLSSHALILASNGLMKGEPLIVWVLTIWSSRLVWISSTAVRMETPTRTRTHTYIHTCTHASIYASNVCMCMYMCNVHVYVILTES